MFLDDFPTIFEDFHRFLMIFEWFVSMAPRPARPCGGGVDGCGVGRPAGAGAGGAGAGGAGAPGAAAAGGGRGWHVGADFAGEGGPNGARKELSELVHGL